jgi:hypothetical protein
LPPYARNGYNLVSRFSTIAAAFDIEGQAIVDGEVVVTHEGRTDFTELQADLGRGDQDRSIYFAFDLLWFEAMIANQELSTRGPNLDLAMTYARHRDLKAGSPSHAPCAAMIAPVLPRDRTTKFISGVVRSTILTHRPIWESIGSQERASQL